MSQILGLPPNNTFDYLVARYLIGQNNPDLRLNTINATAGIPKLLHPHPGEQDEWIGLRLYVTSIICLVITTSTTLLRLILRWYSRRGEAKGWTGPWLAEDLVILPAAVLSALCDIGFWYGTRYAGFGRHTWAITYAQKKFALENTMKGYIYYYGAGGLIKISITLYLRRIPGANLPMFRRFCTLFLVPTVIYTLLSFMFFAFLCGYPRMTFDVIWAAQQPRQLRCLDLDNIKTGLIIIYVLQDFILLGAAVFLYCRIKSRWTRKISLLLLFLLGLSSCIFAVLRIIVLQMHGLDSWTVGRVGLFAMLDQVTAMLVANLPMIYFFIYDRSHQVIDETKRRREIKREKSKWRYYQSLYTTAPPQYSVDLSSSETNDSYPSKIQRSSTYGWHDTICLNQQPPPSPKKSCSRPRSRAEVLATCLTTNTTVSKAEKKQLAAVVEPPNGDLEAGTGSAVPHDLTLPPVALSKEKVIPNDAKLVFLDDPR